MKFLSQTQGKFRPAVFITLLLSCAQVSAQEAGFADDFNSDTLNTVRFFPLDQSDELKGEIVDGRVKLTAIDSSDDDQQTALSPTSVTDYVEAVITLGSESETPTSESQAKSSLDLRTFGTEIGGDVRLRIEVTHDGDGRRQVRYCMDYINNFEGLLANGETCALFPILGEYDKGYRSSIAVNRESRQVVFRSDDFSRAVSLEDAFVAAVDPQAVVWSEARRNATAIVYVDDFRTAPDAMTNAEVEAGLGNVPDFPNAVNEESLIADSAHRKPKQINVGTPMSFVDNFSAPSSTALGLWGGRTWGESGIYFDNDALFLETNAASEEQGNYTNLNLYDPTDFITATLSLPSESALPADSDASNRIRVMLRVLNTEVENSTDQMGDVEFAFGLRERGDGRRQLEYWGDFQVTDEERTNLNLDDLEAFQLFEDFVPEYDTPYEFTIRIDREQNLVTFSMDDLLAEYQIQGSSFQAYKNEVRIENSYSGASGRGVGQIQTIKTENYDFDFAQSKPVIGPYRPQFNNERVNRYTSWQEGQLRMIADGGGIDSWRPTQIVARAQTDYLAADLTLSSESVIASNGRIHVQVGTNLLNDLMDGGFEESSNGQISAHVEIHATDSERYAVYCAWRNDGENWTDVIGGNSDLCITRFDTPVEFDQIYRASVELDRENNRIIYRLDDEEKFHSLTSGIFEPKDYWAQSRVVTYDDSTAIGYVDDFTVGKNSPPLANSLANLIADESDLNSGNTDTGSEGSTEGSNSSGGGSASILTLWLLVCLCVRPRRCRKLL